MSTSLVVENERFKRSKKSNGKTKAALADVQNQLLRLRDRCKQAVLETWWKQNMEKRHIPNNDEQHQAVTMVNFLQNHEDLQGKKEKL